MTPPLRTAHAHQVAAHAAAAALVPPSQHTTSSDLSPERTEQITAELLHTAAQTDTATLRVHQRNLQHYTEKVQEATQPLADITAELHARAQDPTLSVPDNLQALARQAQQRQHERQIHEREHTYDYHHTPHHGPSHGIGL